MEPTFAMLSVELHGGDPRQRQTFNKAMTQSQWHKVGNMVHTYRAIFRNGEPPQAIVQSARADVAAAGRDAGIELFHGVVMLGHSAPVNL